MRNRENSSAITAEAADLRFHFAPSPRSLVAFWALTYAEVF
jgi:hypothetical protein